MAMKVLSLRNAKLIGGKPTSVVIVLCDSVLCDAAYEFKGKGEPDCKPIWDWIREMNPNGWHHHKDKTYCGRHPHDKEK